MIMDNKKQQAQEQKKEQQIQEEQCNKLASIFVECMKKPTTTSKAKCKKEFIAYALKC